MPEDPSDESLVLDACILLNLYGTGEVEAILQSLPFRVVVGVLARQEAKWVRREHDEEREPVDVQPLIDSGLLVEEEIHTPEERHLFVELALVIGDGEAEALALVLSRDYSIATDDRKARRVALERTGESRLWSTLELLREGHTRGGSSETVLIERLRRMRYRASYCPRRSDPLWEWWRSRMGET